MSTLALRPADAFASLADTKARASVFQRLSKAREDQAKQQVLGYLAAMDDARLQGLGFSAEDIRTLRARGLGLPR